MADTPLPLHIRDLVVQSADGRDLLRLPRLDVDPGTLLGVRGPSGAGKTTFLFAIGGLLQAVSGRVCWGDFDMVGAKPERRAAFRAAQMGMIFQDFLLFDELGPIANASLAQLFSPKDQRAKILSAAKSNVSRLGVPTGPRSVTSFSGGERQRVAVSRALATNPAILLADEPTASLDRSAADGLTADLIREVKEQRKTLVVVSHDAALLDQMGRVLTIEDGKVIADEQTP